MSVSPVIVFQSKNRSNFSSMNLIYFFTIFSINA